MLEEIKDFFCSKRWLGFFVGGISPLQISNEIRPLRTHPMEGKYQKFESAKVAQAIIDRAKKQLRWTSFTQEKLWPFFEVHVGGRSNQDHFFRIGVSKLEHYGYIDSSFKIKGSYGEYVYWINPCFVREAMREIN